MYGNAVMGVECEQKRAEHTTLRGLVLSTRMKEVRLPIWAVWVI